MDFKHLTPALPKQPILICQSFFRNGCKEYVNYWPEPWAHTVTQQRYDYQCSPTSLTSEFWGRVRFIQACLVNFENTEAATLSWYDEKAGGIYQDILRWRFSDDEEIVWKRVTQKVFEYLSKAHLTEHDPLSVHLNSNVIIRAVPENCINNKTIVPETCSKIGLPSNITEGCILDESPQAIDVENTKQWFREHTHVKRWRSLQEFSPDLIVLGPNCPADALCSVWREIKDFRTSLFSGYPEFVQLFQKIHEVAREAGRKRYLVLLKIKSNLWVYNLQPDFEVIPVDWQPFPVHLRKVPQGCQISDTIAWAYGEKTGHSTNSFMFVILDGLLKEESDIKNPRAFPLYWHKISEIDHVNNPHADKNDPKGIVVQFRIVGVNPEAPWWSHVRKRIENGIRFNLSIRLQPVGVLEDTDFKRSLCKLLKIRTHE